MKNFQIKKLFFNESLIATQFNHHVNFAPTWQYYRHLVLPRRKTEYVMRGELKKLLIGSGKGSGGCAAKFSVQIHTNWQ